MSVSDRFLMIYVRMKQVLAMYDVFLVSRHNKIKQTVQVFMMYTCIVLCKYHQNTDTFSFYVRRCEHTRVLTAIHAVETHSISRQQQQTHRPST